MASVGVRSTPSAGAGRWVSERLERAHDLDGDVLQRLAHGRQPGREDLRDLRVVEADDRDVATRRELAEPRACAARPSRGCRRRRRTPWERIRRGARRPPRHRSGRCPPPGRRDPWSGGRASRIAPIQPARRSSPMGESLRQPIQAIRVWPLSIRCSVASRVPAAPSTSTHGWVACGWSHGPAERDERRPLLGQPGGLRVAEVGVGDDEGVDRGRAQQVVVAADGVVVVAGEEQHVVAAPRPTSRPGSARSGPSSRWPCPPGRAARAGRSGARLRVRRLRAARLGE